MVSEELYSLFYYTDFFILHTLCPVALRISPENFCKERNMSHPQKKRAASNPLRLRTLIVRLSFSMDWVIDLQRTSVRASTITELASLRISCAHAGCMCRLRQIRPQDRPNARHILCVRMGWLKRLYGVNR